MSSKNSTSAYFSNETLESGLKGRAIRGGGITLLLQGVGFCIQIVGTMVMARLLTPNDFGLVSMVIIFTLLLQNLGHNGFIEAVIQRPEISHRQISSFFWINIGLSVLLALLFLALAPLLAWFYKEPDLVPIASALAASILFGGLANQHIGLLLRKMQFFKVSVNQLIASGVSTAVSILLAYLGWGYWALVAKWLLLPFVLFIGAWILCNWRPGLPARKTGVGPMLKFAFSTYGTFTVSYFRRNIDKIFIGTYTGSQALGFYDRAYHLSNTLPNQLVAPLANVALSVFSRISTDSEKYRQNYLKMISVLAFISMPLSAAMTLNSYDLILFLLGPQWDKAGLIFLALGPSIGISVIYTTHGWLHLSLGTPNKWFRWGIVAFAVTVLCFLAGLSFGAFGIAVAYTVSFYILIGPAITYAGKPVKLKGRHVLSVIWKHYVSALAGGLLAWLLLYSYGPVATYFTALNVIVRIVLSSTICISLYLIIIVLLNRNIEPITEFTSFLKELLKSKKRSA